MGSKAWDSILSLPGLIVEHKVFADGIVRISGRLATSHAPCPDCGTTSSSCHSRYDRTLCDLPISGAKVQLRLSVRRFRCGETACRRRTFSEPLAATFALRYGRRMGRCDALLRAVAVALGGRPGARMMARLAAPWSRDTMLRVLRRGEPMAEAPPPPRVIGIDDFAWRRGHSYGSIVVDLERRQVIDLLLDRQRDTVVAWLRSNPQVEIICRDRGPGYGAGRRKREISVSTKPAISSSLTGSDRVRTCERQPHREALIRMASRAASSRVETVARYSVSRCKASAGPRT